MILYTVIWAIFWKQVLIAPHCVNRSGLKGHSEKAMRECEQLLISICSTEVTQTKWRPSLCCITSNTWLVKVFPGRISRLSSTDDQVLPTHELGFQTQNSQQPPKEANWDFLWLVPVSRSTWWPWKQRDQSWVDKFTSSSYRTEICSKWRCLSAWKWLPTGKLVGGGTFSAIRSTKVSAVSAPPNTCW